MSELTPKQIAWREWAAANKERRAAYFREYEARPERRIKKRERATDWRRQNPELNRARAAKMREKNLHQRIEFNRKYRARKHGASGDATQAQINARAAFFGGVCSYCGGAYECIDHVIPLSRGGSNWPANLRPACLSCNSSKRNKTLAEWAEFKERIAARKRAA
jgi:5-methylcytosine-specific restriction endonuclease McrA